MLSLPGPWDSSPFHLTGVHYGHVFVTGVELIGVPPAVPLTVNVYVFPLTTLAVPDKSTRWYLLSDQESISVPPQYNDSVASIYSPLAKMRTLQFAVVPLNDSVGIATVLWTAARAGTLTHKITARANVNEMSRCFTEFHPLPIAFTNNNDGRG